MCAYTHMNVCRYVCVHICLYVYGMWFEYLSVLLRWLCNELLLFLHFFMSSVCKPAVKTVTVIKISNCCSRFITSAKIKKKERSKQQHEKSVTFTRSATFRSSWQKTCRNALQVVWHQRMPQWKCNRALLQPLQLSKNSVKQIFISPVGQ